MGRNGFPNKEEKRKVANKSMKSRFIISIIYLLYSVNHSLEQLDSLNACEVMLNNEGASGKYLVTTMLLIWIGLYLICYFLKNRFYLHGNEYISIILVTMILNLFIFMIITISNPIFQLSFIVTTIVVIKGVLV